MNLTPAQSKRLEQWTQPRRPSLVKAWAGKCSPRQAIKMQCLDCVGEDVAAVANCGDRCCPLWAFRPFQSKKTNETS